MFVQIDLCQKINDYVIIFTLFTYFWFEMHTCIYILQGGSCGITNLPPELSEAFKHSVWCGFLTTFLSRKLTIMLCKQQTM